MLTPTPVETSRSSRVWPWAGALAIALLLGVTLLRTAWLSDDAHITFRTVDNLLNGYGPVWNTSERVQTFTHPLWMLLLTAAAWVTGEYFYGPIFLSFAVSVAAVILALRLAKSPVAAVLALVTLLFSRAFIDYSSSGLENPLTNLLLAVFATVWWAEGGSRRLFWLSAITALAALNRMDTVLLFLPALGFTFWEQRSWRALGLVLLGFAPFAAWELFSLTYYGFLFPNTAYAKLGSGISRFAMIWQGLLYVRSLLLEDPVSAIAIACAIQSAIMLRERRSLMIAGGMSLYLVYIVWIGGDFMLGRFFAVLVFAASMLIARLPIASHARRQWVTALGTLLVIGLVVCPRPPVLSGRSYGSDRELRFQNGIADERAWYFIENALLGPPRSTPLQGVAEGARARGEPGKVVIHPNIGMYGLGVGPDKHLLDPLALGDPLLARLPALENPNWRIGHLDRGFPAGYQETLQTGTNSIEDPDLARYYDELLQVLRGPLFSARRWEAIIALNLRHHDHLIDVEVYRRYPTRRVARLARTASGAWEWQAPALPWLVPAAGIELKLEQAKTFSTLEIWTRNAIVSEVQFRNIASGRSSLIPTPSRGDLIDGTGYTCLDQLDSRASWPYYAIHLFGNHPDWEIVSVRALTDAPPGYCASRFEQDGP